MSQNSDPFLIALAGNPDVEKSTVFSRLTDIKQNTATRPEHSGDAQGRFYIHNQEYLLVDLPGLYSLSPHSESAVSAAGFLKSGEAHMILLACDAACLEHGLYLLKQILALDTIRECGTPVILVVNRLDDTDRKGLDIDFELLEDVLQIPVISGNAAEPGFLKKVRHTIHKTHTKTYTYHCLDFSPRQLAAEIVRHPGNDYRKQMTAADQIITGQFTSGLFMILLLPGVFWLTILSVNMFSGILGTLLYGLEPYLVSLFRLFAAPAGMADTAVYGIYRSFSRIVSVMLPATAIFFPLCALLEDLGYLPHAAFRLDRALQRSTAVYSPVVQLNDIITNAMLPYAGHFPAALTLTTLFFAAASANLRTAAGSIRIGFLSAVLMTGTIAISTTIVSAVSRFLSRSLPNLRQRPAAPEPPPPRRLPLTKAMISAVMQRTAHVLGRGIAVTAAAGLLIWMLAHIYVPGPEGGWMVVNPAAANTPSLLAAFTGALEPMGRAMGLDGVILAAFIFAWPSYESVLPIIFMAYLQNGYPVEIRESSALLPMLGKHGWSWVTVLCLLVFYLFCCPWAAAGPALPKECGRPEETLFSAVFTTLIGIALCVIVASGCRALGLSG